jgi:hypothetical protein
MPRPGKRRLEDFDPNQSDPNDSDFNDDAPSSPQRRRSSKKKSSQHRTPQKKRSRRNYGTDSDIVDDDDDISEEEFTASEEEEDVELNPNTGRAVRRVTKKTIDYEESDAEDEKDFIEDTAESEDQRQELNISPKKTRINRLNLLKPSCIVKLPFTNWEVIGVPSSSRPTPRPEQEPKQTRTRSTRSRTASRPPTAPTPMTGTRKSSRLSKEPEAHVELSNSGRHAVPASKIDSSDDDDEVTSRRRTSGSKGPQTTATKQPRKMPSTVMEESQGHTEEMPDAGEEVEEPPHDVVDSVEIHMEEVEVEQGEVEEAEETEVVVPADEEPGEQPEPQESEEDEGPVGPRRTLRVRTSP